MHLCCKVTITLTFQNFQQGGKGHGRRHQESQPLAQLLYFFYFLQGGKDMADAIKKANLSLNWESPGVLTLPPGVRRAGGPVGGARDGGGAGDPVGDKDNDVAAEEAGAASRP